ncbi:acyl-CoA dehydrogenase family protein [Nocardia stercoris]|uniref:Acyl-CoA dehydrogenase n=1 Tax=Nocardia stercoris TaxID=2483361 RepID=A0A3M2LJ77_9NOCA|nr:acyl-CoA dehydrogenase family protein [Nocardia stercoris]RMI34818.1 acyl-CoA dehydrogenase [Nocardia stercoris]
MDLELTAEEAKFRDGIREVLYNEVPAEVRRRSQLGLTTREDHIDSQRILNKHGLAAPLWPEKWGGRGWNPTQQHIYTLELQRSRVPLPLAFNVSMVGPIIAEFGSQEQQERFLPATANLDIWWSQGFSEPEAGSDLASLKTTARREGDEYIVNGQKTWTTLGQYGDWMFLLARTDPKAPRKQLGISFLLLDMKTPGIERRPIKLIDGSVEVNEFFFDDVRVPAENLVGEEGKGWTYAKFLLGNERNSIAQMGTSQAMFTDLVGQARVRDLLEAKLADDTEFRSRLHDVKLGMLALEATQLRVTGESENGVASPVSSLLKLRGTQLLQEVTALQVYAAGSDSLLVDLAQALAPGGVDLVADAVAATEYLNMRKLSIFGGTNEIQRQIIDKTILGL